MSDLERLESWSRRLPRVKCQVGTFVMYHLNVAILQLFYRILQKILEEKRIRLRVILHSIKYAKFVSFQLLISIWMVNLQETSRIIKACERMASSLVCRPINDIRIHILILSLSLSLSLWFSLPKGWRVYNFLSVDNLLMATYSLPSFTPSIYSWPWPSSPPIHYSTPDPLQKPNSRCATVVVVFVNVIMVSFKRILSR